MGWVAVWLAALGSFLAFAWQGRTAYSPAAKSLALGKLLVAQRGLPDPNFAETVVLLVQYDEKGAMGLVLNHQTEVRISEVLDEIEAAKDRRDPIFRGGPVERGTVWALLRSKTSPPEAKHIFEDVHLVTSKPLLEKTFASHASEKEVRVFLGYAGWGPRQLDREVMLGGWHVFNGDADLVFGKASGIWPKLIRQTESQIAVRPPLQLFHPLQAEQQSARDMKETLIGPAL